MFVSKNTLNAIKEYFFEELKAIYPEREIESFFYILCEKYLGFSRSKITLNINSNLSESELLKFHFALKELKKEKPIQYITGEQYFYEHNFLVNKHTLIPRPETEELVDLIVKENPSFSGRILDIGTGSGAIAISLDLELQSSNVTAFDVSKEAISMAIQNKEALNSEVDFVYQDILNPDYKEEKFDVIVSNPPYVKMEEKDLMNKNVLDYEPHLALFVEDTDPLLFYRKIVEFCKLNLTKNGKLYFEINEQYGEATKELMEENNFESVRVIQDLNGKDRIVAGNYLGE